MPHQDHRVTRSPLRTTKQAASGWKPALGPRPTKQRAHPRIRRDGACHLKCRLAAQPVVSRVAGLFEQSQQKWATDLTVAGNDLPMAPFDHVFVVAAALGANPAALSQELDEFAAASRR